MDKQRINRLRTFGENLVNSAKAGAVYTAIAGLGLTALGVDLGPAELQETVTRAVELYGQSAPLARGFATGLVQNGILIGSTLASLAGKTKDGNRTPTRTESDGTVVFQFSCVDGRRVDQSGVASAGSFGIMGAGFKNVLEAAAIQQLAPDSELGNFAVGYALGSNVLTGLYSHAGFLVEVGQIAFNRSYAGQRIKIEMMDHFEGCGAQGFTNPLTYILKFITHNLTLADISALPNEVAGYVYVNGILSPAIGLLSLGRVSVSALERHSDMEKSH